MCKILIVSLLLMSTTAWTQSSSTLMGPRALGLGYASACLSDEWSIFNNVAGLAKIKSHSISCAYDVNALSKNFSKTAAAINIPGKLGYAIGFYRFGDSQYQEQVIKTGVGSSIGITSLGLKMTYVRYSIQGMGDKSIISVSFGGVTAITPRLSVGATISNLNQSYLSKVDKERLPTILTAGFLFKVSEFFIASGEVEKDMDYPLLIKAGMEYVVHKKFLFRTGFNINPKAAFFGFGFKLRKFVADYGMQHSFVLGTHFQAGVIYQFKR